MPVAQFEITPEFLASQGLSPTFVKRFWEKVNKNGPVPKHMPHLGRCWVWTRPLERLGYARMRILPYNPSKDEPKVYVHIISWIVHFGKRPALKVLHKCDIRHCVRPSHLFLGTQNQNIADRVAKGRSAKGNSIWTCKLSEQDVLEIRKSYVPRKITLSDLGKKFGITLNQVWMIVHRKHWKHI